MTAVKLHTLGSPATDGTAGSVLFIDGSGDLAQDNARFFWDDTNATLTLGDNFSPYSAMVFTNVLANVFINGGPGSGLSGMGNTAIGHRSLESLTTGSDNLCFGTQAGGNLTTGSSNTFIGATAGIFVTVGAGNTIIGNYPGTSGLINGFFLAKGGGIPLLDYNVTNPTVVTFQQSITGLDFNSNPNVIEQLNGTNAQTYRLYNTTDYTNSEWASLDWQLTSNVFRLSSQAAGTGTVRLVAINGFSKAGAPANTDLPSGTFALIDDTSGNQTWLVFNKGGTIRKVQLT